MHGLSDGSDESDGSNVGLNVCFSLWALLLLTACASGGGGSGPAAVTVYCGPSELQAKPCGTVVQPVQTSRTVTSTPLPQSPGTTPGTWDTLAASRPAWKDARAGYASLASTSSVRIETDPVNKRYTLLIDASGFPSRAQFELPDQWGQKSVETIHYSDGTSGISTSTFDYFFGLQSDLSTPVETSPPARRLVLHYRLATPYISMGRLKYELLNYSASEAMIVYPSAEREHYDFGAVQFVHGQMTASDGIPLSGIARYRGRVVDSEQSSLPGSADSGPPFVTDGLWPDDLASGLTFTADFSRALLRADIDLPSRKLESETSSAWVWGLRASGEVSMNGMQSLQIPMSGNLFTDEPDRRVRTLVVSGTVDAAFFGPAAEAIGGTFSLRTQADADVDAWWMGGTFAADRLP